MKELRRSERLAWRRVRDEVLIISSDSNSLTVLNDTGARVWELLDACDSRDAIAAAICGEFEVTLEDARRDVDRFIAELAQRQLIKAEV